jgi:hypothetical protein
MAHSKGAAFPKKWPPAPGPNQEKRGGSACRSAPEPQDDEIVWAATRLTAKTHYAAGLGLLLKPECWNVSALKPEEVGCGSECWLLG